MRVQLFVSCLVDLFYPEVGERTVALLGAGGRLHRSTGSPRPRRRLAASRHRATVAAPWRSIRGVHAPRELDVVVSPYR